MTAILTLSLALLGIVYLAAARRRNRAAPQITWFALGWIALAIALISPLHELAEQSLSAHMLQHEILIMIAAPLLALGRPHLAVIALLPERPRRRAARCLRFGRGMSPTLPWAAHALALWIWHVPLLYDAAATNPLAHGAQHLSFFGTGLLFWWSVLQRRDGYGAAGLYVFLSSLHSGLLGALLFVSPRLWYASYARYPGALADQQLAGILMWVPGSVVFALTAVLLLWRWMRDMELRAAARERLASRRAGVRTVVMVVIVVLGPLALVACNDATATAIALTGGDPERGEEAIGRYGCWTCHTIPGIRGANAVVGPPLDKIASRSYVAGQANSVAHMIEWIREPQKIRNGSPMPNMGVSEREARDIAAYLYTLR